MENSFPEWWDKGLEDWSVERMFEKLNSLGIKIDKEEFLSLTDKYSSAQKLADSELYPQVCFSKCDREEDFVWMAADELWKKLRKDKESLEMISEKIEKPFEEAEKLEWERYPNRILELEEQGFDTLMDYSFLGYRKVYNVPQGTGWKFWPQASFLGYRKVYNAPQGTGWKSWPQASFLNSEGEIKRGFYNDLQPYFLDIAYYLCIFQDHLAYSGKWEKRLEVSRKLYSLDPENPDFKDLCAEALLYWGDIGEGERLYNELIKECPKEILHAVNCADMFFLGYEGMKLNQDFEKAKKYYLIAEARFTEKISWEDRKSIIQRLFNLYSQSGNEQKVEEYRRKRKQSEHYYCEDMKKPAGPVDLEDFEIDENEPDILPKKIGRNEPCPCGSGKKYKKCCGK